MLVTTHLLDRRPDIPLQVLANRYRVDDTPREAGHTLVFFHATGTHKETWEPLLQHLFALDGASTGRLIREAWSIEFPNHGESAVLNEAELQRLYPDHWDGFIYPKTAYALLSSCPGGVDLSQHSLVGIGHSVGGNALILLQSLAPLPFKSLILLDATIGFLTPERAQLDRMLAHIAWTKQDVWASRKEARKDLSTQPGYKRWDPAVLDRFVEKGLRTHPAEKYPDPYKFKGVTLACSRSLEAASYRANSHHDTANNTLHKLYADGVVPVHLIFSKHDEFRATKLKKALMQGLRGGGPVSVQWIDDAGHLFVQHQPVATANAIWQALQGGRRVGARL
ncbi:alpha/beta-hydrolase [Artomyces pyxidatus]|uniref:Alpha/beta-hydrolase n=1 Tax=Artomyces pyxidatus TaxID=48021 RepID=A0ACB8SI48_9AGAM|nr:alpha/beta-hydrolase [Artomyces pyxidatus]